MMCGLTIGSLEWRFIEIFYRELQFERCYEGQGLCKQIHLCECKILYSL